MSAVEDSNPNIKTQGTKLSVHRSNPTMDLKFKKIEKPLSIKSSVPSPKSLDFHLSSDNSSPIDFSANNSNLQPIRITTSKKWVLPPRPKPGRKPSSIANSCGNNHNNNENHATSTTTISAISHTNDFNNNNNKKKLKKSEFTINRNLQKKPVHALPSVSNIKIMPKSSTNPLNLDPNSSSSIPTPSPTPGSLSPNHLPQSSINNTNLTTSLNLNSSHSISPISIPASPDRSKSTPSPIGSVSPLLVPNNHLSKIESQKFQKNLQSKQLKQIKLLPTPMSISNSSSNSTLTSISNKTTTNITSNDSKTKPAKFKNNKNLINSKQSNHLSSSKMIEIDSSIVNNPIKQEILKINEENYYLKLEVIRLVSNLKNLRDEVQPIVEKDKPLKPNNIIGSNGTGDKTKIFKNSLSCSLSAASSNSLSSISSPKSLSLELVNQNNILDNNIETNNKKRTHDEDINDLIVSLIDLNHSQQVESPNLELLENKSKKLNENKNNEIENYLLFKDDDKLLDLSEEDDLISTVSTTPSTMLSLIATNETMDSISCGNSLVGSNDDFDFKLIDIPTNNRSGSITDPTITITNNSDNNLNTLSTVNEIMDFEMIGSLDLVNQKSKVEYISDSLDSLYSNEYFEFNENDKTGVDLEFDSFINGKNLDV